MWGSRHQTLILLIIAIVIGAGVALALIATFYHAPSCTDNKQNQGEEGIDCGGPCSYLCTAGESAPYVEFVRQLSPAPGRTDVIAYVENRNADVAAKGVKYTITLYGTDNLVVAEKSGTVDLPPSALVPIFVPNFYSGYQTVARAFLTFDDASFKWYRYKDTRPVLPATNIALTNGASAPRVTADIGNPTALPLFRIPVVVAVFDTDGNAIAASATVLPQIPAMGTAPAVFTWNAPYPGPAAREDVIPLAPLP
jgi:hypothetical protein